MNRPLKPSPRAAKKPTREALLAALAERDRELAEARRREAATAIENVRLFDEVQARTRDLTESLRQQTATADVLKVISRSAFDLQTVLETLINSAVELCGANRGAIFLRDGDVFLWRAASRSDPEYHDFMRTHPRTPGRGSMAARVALSGHIESIPDILEDPEFELPLNEMARIRAILGAPLLRDGKVEGVLALSRYEPGPFTQRQIDLVQTFADQAIIAIENVRLFDEVQARTRDLTEALQQQTATADVLKVISRSAFDLETVLGTLVRSAVALCDADGGQIFRRQGDVYRYAASRMNVDPAYLQHEQSVEIKPGRGTLIGRVALENCAVSIADAWSDPEYGEKDKARVGNVRAMLGVPLMREGEPIGAFALARSAPIPFTQRQIELVATFADQAVIAIENVRLFDEVQARTRDLTEALQQQTATAEVLKVISRSVFDLQTVLDTLVESAYKLCGAGMGLLYLRGDDAFECKAIAGVGAAEANQLFKGRPIRAGRGTAAERVILSGKVQIITDLFEDSDFDAKLRAAFRDAAGTDSGIADFRSVLGVPMKRDDAVVGVLVIARSQTGPFPQRQIELLQTFADQAVIAIENVRLFDEVQARTRDLTEALQQQTATADVLKAISRTAFDLDTVLATLVSTAARLCGANYGEIFRRHGGVYRHAASTMNFDPAYDQHERSVEIEPGRGTLIGRVAMENRAVSIADAWSDPEYAEKDEARMGDVRAMLGVPLMREAEPIGAFALGRSAPIPFTERQIELVTTFADQAVIAIENVRLFDEVQSRTRDLTEALQQQTATADVLKVISRSAFDLKTVLRTLVRSAVELCSADNGEIFLRRGEFFYFEQSYGLASEMVGYLKERPFAPGRGSVVARVALSGTIETIPDVLTDPEFNFPAALNRARSLLGVPLLRDERVEGVFVMIRPEPGEFAPRLIELVRTFADQAVIAIENVRLFDEVQARTRDLTEALQLQTATSDVLKVISRSAFDLQAVFDTLTASAVELCGAFSGSICVRDGDLYRYRGNAGDGVSPAMSRYLADHPATPGQGSIVGRVLLSGKVEAIPDVLEDADYVVPLGAHGQASRSLLGVPLLAKDRIEGALVLTRQAPGRFTERQIEIVQTFADQAVIAIENVRLFDEVQARTRELAASLDDLRKAQDRLIQSEKLASLGQLTAGIAHEIKNPLNFVNNFSALSRELLDELRGALANAPLDKSQRDETEDLIRMIGSNLDKVVSHGKRADSIVKNMLLHSREGSGERTSVNINAMVEDALNLAYHGARAEKPGFNVTIEKSLDPDAGAAELYAQEMTRVLLNLISNGFYATAKRKLGESNGAYEPTITASTRDFGDRVEIAVRDNGTGIPEEVKAKMFNPFFTTKPAGEGTGLGLSLSHDIVVKQHGGTLEVATEPGAFTQFTILLPRSVGAAAQAR